MSGLSLEGIGPSPLERRRITLRSPRAALEPEHVPVPTRRSKRARHPLVRFGNAVLTFLILIVIAAGVGLVVGKQRFDAPGPLAQDRIVNVPRGHGMRDIAELLEREGVIDQPWTFMAGVIVLKARDGLKSGEYQFPKQASLRDVVDTITDGKVVQHLFTVLEGQTSEQIVARLMENTVLGGSIKEIPREGTLLPETYKFTRGTPRELVIQRMQQAQARVLKEAWERRMPDLPITTPEQLVILASIVEKETGRIDERTRVAAVFVNRLRQKMKLQSDPTIIYGLVGGKGSLGHVITKSEKEQATAYNTYTIDGLPPGPIANPGRASLEAAANPARTRELYFVADGTGGHTFSDNYEQHQKAVARLRAHEQRLNGAKSDPVAPQPAAAAPAPRPPPPPAPRPARRR
ncbi:MAG: endolytic transglycosylase MltG [Rhizobiales bacterium]|nr:endolytic transglycosylase MltG [Hyphomicrobiales bacterium]